MKLFLAILFCWQCQAVELVVRLIDKTHRDEAKDRIGCTKTGMIIEVRRDGAKYGKSEGPPNYCIIKLPGIKPDEFAKYLAPEMDATGTNVYRARAYKVDLTALTSASKTTADSIKSGSLNVSEENAKTAADLVKTNVVNIASGKLETATVKP